MSILFDNQKLLSLIANLNTITGIRANVYDRSGRDLGLAGEGSPFCRLIQSCPSGHKHCINCDHRAITSCGEREEVYFYRCHAGICEAILPIYSNGHPLAYLLFGQFLDSSPKEGQWSTTLASLDWYPGSITELHTAFNALRQCSSQELAAYVEILKAVKAYIDLSGMIHSTEYTDRQRLELHLDQHYMENLTLSSISRDLNIGRTKLCRLAKSLPGERTLSQLITHRRIQAAKELLLNTDLPISAVGEAVGISDYNYFSKVFRSVTGTTPSKFRKNSQDENDSTPPP